MRTIVVPLLAVYALVLTIYLGFHIPALTGSGGLPGSTADINLPSAPPFDSPKPTSVPEKDLLARVAIENELRYTDLQSFICTEQIERFKGRLDREDRKQIDTVTAQVSFENGVENYIGIQQDNRARASMFEIPGAWSEGEFGTLLRQTRTLLTTRPITQQKSAIWNGQPSVTYSMDVPGEESPWNLNVDKKTYRVPFRTDVLVAKNDGRILQIKRVSTAMPPSFGISEIAWSVDLRPVRLDGNEWLLPTTGEYSILYQKANRREWNVIAFGNYHRYQASSTIHF